MILPCVYVHPICGWEYTGYICYYEKFELKMKLPTPARKGDILLKGL